MDEFKPRKWQSPNPGRLDDKGVEWWECDPYPTWYRWTCDCDECSDIRASDLADSSERHGADNRPKGQLITEGYPEEWDNG